jgi:diguanylate cyclase (GGDEF)-like protein/PAS domain S-box-containing protein
VGHNEACQSAESILTSAPVPPDEAARLASLLALEVLDTTAEQEFDALARAAAAVCGVPIALISLVDAQRQWFKANVGLPGVSETPRDVAFCAHAILEDSLFVVPDAARDSRFDDNPLVVGQPGIRFYAGAPISLSDGSRVGTLCVIDREPRQLTDSQRAVMQHLSVAASRALEGRFAMRRLQQATERQTQSAHDLHIIFESVPAILAYWNRDLTCRFANRAYEHWFGVKPEALVGTHLQDLLGPELYALNKPFVDGALAGKPQSFERLIPGPDGTKRPALANYLPDIVDGDVRGFLVHVSDVTSLKDAEAALRAEIAERERAYELLHQSNERLGEAQRLGRIGSWAWRVAEDVTTWSDELHRIFGREPGGPAPSLAEHSTLYSAESFARLGTAVETALRNGQPYALELEYVHAGGSHGWLDARGEAVQDEMGRVVRLQGTVQDITERRKLTSELAKQHELLRVTLQSIGDAVITTDGAGQITWLNPVAERMTGWLSSEAVGRPIAQVFHIVHEETRKPSLSPVDACLNQGSVVALASRTVLVSRAGIEFGIEDSASPIRNERGEVLGVVLVFHDVSEQRRLSGEMNHRATHDVLTGLINRAEFEVRLQRSLDKSHEEQSEHALMFIDLDQFKLVNDACGHSAGDALLQQVSKLLGEAVRTRDTLARLGGDEFAVILEHCTTDQAQRVAQQICDRLDEFRFLHSERRFRIGASIGLVTLDRRWNSTATVLQAADAACYAAKEAGRNRVHVWHDTDAAMLARTGETHWASRLEQALDDGRFVLFAQRIFSLGTESERIHAEVLLRMVDDDGSLIAPGAFLPAAERFYFCSRIDRWVLGRAIALLSDRVDLSSIDTLCVNLSGQSIGDKAFHRDTIEKLVVAGSAVCRCICLEITETAAITNMADAVRFIEDVRNLGVRIALDDFGAGASSFGYLKSLKVDLLKIDGQFVRDVIDDPLDAAAVRCFVDVARVIGVKTVAEFVDKSEVLARMKEIGVDYAQGFFLHRPEPIELVLDVALF